MGSSKSGRRDDFWGNRQEREGIQLPESDDDLAWRPRYNPHSHRVPQDAAPLVVATAELPQPPPERSVLAAPPCAALQAVLTCFSLHQRASWGRPLTSEEQKILARIEEGLRSADIRSRRKWKRHGTSRPVQIDGGTGGGVMLDLSAGGLRVSNADILPPRDTHVEVSMRVAVASGERTLVFPSRVTWVDTQAVAFGVAFVAPARWEAA